MDVRFRQDLKITQRQQGLDVVWVIKDPVSFSHFLFSEQEYFLVNLLDGKRSIEEVLSSWRDHFKSNSLSPDQVQQFVRRLINDNLVVIDRTCYGSSLVTNRRSAKRQGRYRWMANPLAIRFRGIDPTWILNQFDWVGKLFFHPAVVLTLMMSSLGVLVMLLGNFESVSRRIPAIQHLLSTQGLIGLVLTLAVVKILHELGHALACRRFGGECFEIGVMLLALIPTLYCNVSDAWTIRERWKRMMVSFAGMYVEICLAGIAAIAWFMTPPGLLNALLFNVVLLCSVNTVLLNGNPLLRYDGYYLLSDWLDQPNLSQAAGLELKKSMTRLVGGRTGPSDASSWLLVYGLLSFLYRWFVIGVILYAVLTLASGWGAGEIGIGICAILMGAMLMGRMRTGKHNLEVIDGPGHRPFDRPVNWLRSSLVMLVAAGLLAGILLLPLPHSIYGELEIGIDGSVPVFAPSDGRLVSIAQPYDSVAKGEVVARLENRKLEQKVQQQRLELERARNELAQLTSRANEAPAIASSIEVARKNVRATEFRFEALKKECERLMIPAPTNGIVFPAPNRKLPGVGETDRWNTALVDDCNQNCSVRSSEHLLTVGDPTKKQAMLFVDESDIGFVTAGQEVRLTFDRIPGGRFDGVVEEIFEDNVDADTPGFDVALSPAQSAAEPPQEKTYRVIVKLAPFPAEAVAGSIGRARIAVPRQTIATRVLWVLKRAVNTRL